MELHHKMVSLETFEYCIQEFLHLFASLYGVKETVAVFFNFLQGRVKTLFILNMINN